jgi:hypothetical protein
VGNFGEEDDKGLPDRSTALAWKRRQGRLATVNLLTISKIAAPPTAFRAWLASGSIDYLQNC